MSTCIMTPLRGFRGVPSGSLSPLIPQLTCATAISGVRNLMVVSVTVRTLSLNCIACVLDCRASNSARLARTCPATLTKRTSSATRELKALTSFRFHASSQRASISRMAFSSSACVAETGLATNTTTANITSTIIGGLQGVTCSDSRAHARGLLDQLIRTSEQRRRNGQAQRLRGLEIDDQREFRRLLDRKITGLGTPENLVDVGRGAAMHLRLVGPVRHQETRLRLQSAPAHRRQPLLQGAFD